MFCYTVSFFTRTYGNLLTVPKNAVAKLGDRVEFECSTSETIGEGGSLDWTFFSATSKNKSIITETGIITQTCHSKYAVENSIQGRYNLIMNSVDLSFGGMYTCTWSGTAEETPSSSAELIVIGIVLFFHLFLLLTMQFVHQIFKHKQLVLGLQVKDGYFMA